MPDDPDGRKPHVNVRLNTPTHERVGDHNRASETLSATIDRALDALEYHDQLLDLAFSATHADETRPTPIVNLSDGPRLLLADRSVVRPLVYDREDDDTVELPFIGRGQGTHRYGFTDTVELAFVDDPEAAKHDAVSEVLRNDE